MAGTTVLGYVRVSTAEQTDSGAGLAAQEASIRDECERRGWALLEVVRDAGESGKSLDRRACFTHSIASLEGKPPVSSPRS